jgi:vitamin B12 transporter
MISINKITSLALVSAALSPLYLSAETMVGANPAESPAADSALETVVVSAAREPLTANQVGGAMSVIDSQTLRRRQAASVGEMLRSLPGVAVSRAGGLGAQSQLRVRGSEANHVLVMIDGVAVNDPGQGGDFNLAHLYNYQFEQVEFLRGPQSALWGSDALAGVINISSKKSDPGRSGDVFVEGGSDGYYHLGGSVGLASDRAYLRISGQQLSTDGENVSRLGSEDDGYDNTRLAMQAGLRVNDQLKFSTSWQSIDATSEFDGIDFSTGLPADQSNETDSQQLCGSLRADLTLMEGRWRHQLGLVYTDHDNDDETENPFAPTGFDVASTQAETLQVNYQSHFDLNEAQTISLLVEDQNQDLRQRGPASFFGDPNRDESVKTLSIAGEYRAQLYDDVFFQASVRHDRNDDFDDATTWRASTAWWVSAATKLRTSIGTGVKNPTFSERFGYFTNFIGNPDLQPETSQGWEVGVDHAFGSDLAVQLTYFRADLEDEIAGFVFDPGTGGFTAANDSGESERRGVELSAQWQVTEQISVSAAYTYLDASEQNASGADQDEIRRPSDNASLDVTWQPSEKFSLYVRGDHNGEQDDFFFPPVPPFQARVELDDYTLLSVGAERKMGAWGSIYGRIENGLDEDYEEVFGFATPGRTYIFGLRVEIGGK